MLGFPFFDSLIESEGLVKGPWVGLVSGRVLLYNVYQG